MVAKKKSGKKKQAASKGMSEQSRPETPSTDPQLTNGQADMTLDESHSTSPPSASASSAPEPSPSAPEPDFSVRAEELKEQGNKAFREKLYGEAIDYYSKAIELKPSEPTYLTNRAASYMSLKRFRQALEDCQKAATLQSADPSPKTLVRLAKCQLALGLSEPALSSIRTILGLEPGNVAAKQLQTKALDLEAHLRNLERARTNKDWGMARLALDRCIASIEGEADSVPTQWRCWRIELELARGNWDAANVAANDALRLDSNSADVMALRGLVQFLTAKLPGALQHAVAALRLDPDNARAKSLRQRVKAVERLKDEGNAQFKSGRYQDAISKYGEALDAVGNSPEEGKGGLMRATLLSNRATAMLKLDRYEDALTDIEESLELNPTNFKAYRTRARIHLHFEKFDPAIADFKSALEQARMDGSHSDEKSLKEELRQAEVALKRSKSKDYYKILGLDKNCSEVDIKKAYRRESLKHHPDKGGDEEKFKLVVEAHTVLSDPRRRERYDMGVDEDGATDSGGMGGMGGFAQEDLAELFMRFGGGRGGGFHFSPGGPGSHFAF